MDSLPENINHIKKIILTLVAIVIGKKILKFLVNNYDSVVIGAFILYFLNDNWKEIADEAMKKYSIFKVNEEIVE